VRALVAGNDRAGHAIRRVGDATRSVAAQVADAPADDVRVTAAYRAVRAAGVQPLMHRQQVGAAVTQHTKGIVALLVGQRQAAGDD